MVRIGTIGTSTICSSWIIIAGTCEEVEVVACYSRDENRAAEFAKKHGIKKHYSDMEAIAADEEIDAVYIAAPNILHYELAMFFLKRGKHVLCEKTFATTEKQAKEMIAYAKQRGLVILEEIRTIHDPGFKFIEENISRLGQIRNADLHFCQYSSRYDSFLEGKEHNIFDLATGAGGLMDVGIYVVEPMVALFGEPGDITSKVVKLRTGADGEGKAICDYGDKLVSITYSKITSDPRPSVIQGEKGEMTILSAPAPGIIEISLRDGTKEVHDFTCKDERILSSTDYVKNVHNIRYAIKQFARAIDDNENIDKFHDITITSMRVCDRIREQNDIRFE